MLKREIEIALGNLSWKEIQDEVYEPKSILRENADSQMFRDWLKIQDDREDELMKAQMQYAKSFKRKNGIDDLIIGQK